MLLRVLAFFIAAGLAGFAGWEKPWDETQPIRLEKIRFEYGGVQRNYLIFDPRKLPHAPVVIVLHGGGSMASRAVRMSRFNDLAEKEGFIAAYPDGTGPLPFFLHSWNAGHCCAGAMANKVDDVGFIGAVIDRIIDGRHADPARIYLTGLSAGGMMSHKVGVELTDKLAAIAPVVGALFGDEPPPNGPLSVMMVQGAQDQVVPLKGGPLGTSARIGDRDIIPAWVAADFWAKADGCSTRDMQVTDAWRLDRWEGCKAGTEVVLYSLARAGHGWPGEKPGGAFDATSEIWAFFKQHPKESGGEAVAPPPPVSG